MIGDGLNDVLMFERAGFSIAMGQADDKVRRAADVVTAANTEEGFARAIEDYILSAAPERLNRARRERAMILAGDIGGTKTDLATFTNEGGKLEVVAEQRFVSPQRDG